jgi:hypothetical protein
MYTNGNALIMPLRGIFLDSYVGRAYYEDITLEAFFSGVLNGEA